MYDKINSLSIYLKYNNDVTINKQKGEVYKLNCGIIYIYL